MTTGAGGESFQTSETAHKTAFGVLLSLGNGIQNLPARQRVTILTMVEPNFQDAVPYSCTII